ncbi:MAG TPA: CDP-alcohol phosphatidyltransferase family protein [Anaerolineae bacterium]|nr:CDP-alcohol phosphatidyltransferase family protein [Anaerolineae bacterium]
MRGRKGESEQPATLTDWARKWGAGILEPLARLIARTGISPNAVTVTGLVLNAGVAWVLARGHMRVGGLLVALAGLLDALDGTLARLTGQKSRFGAFLDSFVDRLCEATLYLGLLIFYTRHGARREIVLIYATIVGSLLISYARARAEGLGLECKVGLLTRMERAAILALALLLDRMSIALWALAVLTNFTALQRVYHVWRATKGDL